MHCWFLHWNWFGQAVEERINGRCICPIHQRTWKRKIIKLDGSEALTVFNVDGLERCLKTSVHVGFVGGKPHSHCVGVAGHSHFVVRLLSTNSEDERHMQWRLCRVVMFVCFIQKCRDSLFPVDLHVIFATVLTVLTRLRQIELFEG